MQNNPFDITFGKPPVTIIERYNVSDVVINAFDNFNPPIYIFCGPRGSGKTVAMTSISNKFKEMNNWIVIELNPHNDLEEQLASSLYQKGSLKHLFIKKEFNFSFKGFGISLTGEMPIVSTSGLIERMFEYLKKKRINVLICIDEVNNNQYMKVFAHDFQYYVRQNYNVCLLMTGLYENISNLENSEGLTFLYRAPKLYLPPLNARAIVNTYMNELGMNEKDAIDAANITNGYAFAYQLLGYILFKQNKKKVDEQVINELDILLDEKSYSKIYSELTSREKDIVNAIAEGNETNEEIKNKLSLKDGTLSTYKNTLDKKGIIDVSNRGISSFKLPRFKEYLLYKQKINY